MLYRLSVRTGGKVEFQDITGTVRDTISSSGVKSGVCHVFVPHTTAGITINEHADPSVVQDIAAQLDKMVPQHNHYRHLEGNSPAHIKASLMGSSQTIFIEDGRPVLGTWQGVFFCEFDGPRNRSLLIKIVGDGTSD
ncbi:MAG TPA: YjbQ family protein [Dehalococcoidia bacterium]|nr:YjbQ family protein [Dehalococcoidia bacterium]